MLKKLTSYRSLLIFACIATAIASTGCRSMPGRNLFAFGNQPSAETLAGSGPTTTYPAPPSASATPQAIASIAGGTSAPNQSSPNHSMPGKDPMTKPATAQVAGIDISPGFATPASSVGPTNMAAAQANGIHGDHAHGGIDKSVAPVSGYTFGSKALTPKSNDMPETKPVASASSYAKNSSYAPPVSGFKTPSTSITPPPASGYSPPVASLPANLSVPEATANPPASGYTLPTDAPAIASISPPTPDVIEISETKKSNPFAPPAAIKPDFSTASTAGSLSAPTTSIQTPSSSTENGGYMPGSTSTSHGYPTGDVAPTTSGSFYR